MKDKIILYVDDDIDDIEIWKDIFTNFSNAPQFDTLNSGESALEHLAAIKEDQKRLCFLLVDMNMPKMDGKKLVEIIKQDKEFQEIPIAFVSTSMNPRDEEMALNLGVLYYRKPSSMEGLQQLASEIIEHCAEV
jgi:CheY-like chemotaxis protein